ncbi:FAD-binding oxidoreductase [Simplicispira psychrophila]|uniref:FAD-binding oxidoreductase n=1 Tax=Simplicispira psychrophila TaxID=80882 RepID=UPI0004815061|nr:FAD-dependent oxidoreductase [Simplicispira psychrophila]
MEHEPENIEAVRRLVQAARATKVPLYPISRGMNWGYGSRSPVVAGSELVNLGRMNRILNADRISVDHPVAVLEPGVTQGQLHDFLTAHCPQLTFNVTGSSRDTSILGNALDRGVGYFGPRREDLFGLEVVCGSGQVLRTGFRRLGEQSPLAHSHPYGLGPMLDGLFFQGNFGIVTSACFRLVPRRPREVAISMALSHEKNLAPFLDELAKLKRDGLLTSVTHVANRARSHATLAFGIATYLERQCGASAEQVRVETTQALNLVAPFEWTSLAAVTGNSGQVRAALAEIGARMGKLAQIRHVTTARLNVAFAIADRLRTLRLTRLHAAALSAIRPLHGLALGVPTDVAIENLLWKFSRTDLAPAHLDESNCGLLFVNPALPMDGGFVAAIVEEFKHIAQRHGHELYVTLNIETASSMVAVINLLFDRGQPAEVAQAHRCADALLEHIRASGLELYRARTDNMEAVVAADPDYWATVRALKGVLDPDNIIAPGRYNLAR